MSRASANIVISGADAASRSQRHGLRVISTPERLPVREVLKRYDLTRDEDDQGRGWLGLNFMPLWWFLVGIGRKLWSWLSQTSAQNRQALQQRYRRIAGSVGSLPKYVIDLFIATTMLILLLPLIIAVALVIRIQLGGQILFAHTRLGRDGHEFSCYKFRSMVNNGDAILADHLSRHPAALREWNETQKLRDDPRVTKLGKMLRKTSIDELPQLFNVIMGDMSCVGPRPIVRKEIEKYGPHIRDYLRARPGLTGLWQVSGRTSLSYERRVALDTYYVRRWSMLQDFSILIRTIPAVIKTDDTA